MIDGSGVRRFRDALSVRTFAGSDLDKSEAEVKPPAGEIMTRDAITLYARSRAGYRPFCVAKFPCACFLIFRISTAFVVVVVVVVIIFSLQIFCE
jgi:hypothetical protein